MQTELLLYGVGSIKHIWFRYAAVHGIGAEGHLVSGFNHRVYLARGGMPCLEADGRARVVGVAINGKHGKVAVVALVVDGRSHTHTSALGIECCHKVGAIL